MLRIKTLLFLGGLLLSLCYISCSKTALNKPDPQKSLSVTAISTSSGSYNASVIITGTGFSIDTAADKVTFNGKPGKVTAATATSLTVIVPKGAGTGNIKVTIGSNTVAGPTFTYVYTVMVSTLAGSGRDTVIDGTGVNASFHGMWGIASDSKGNIYAPDPQANVIRKVTPKGVVTTFAGSGKLGYADGKGRAATFGTPQGVVVDSDDNVFITDCYYRSIRKITPDGTVTTLVKNDGTFRLMDAFTIDAQNNMYLEDFNTLYKITPAGVVSALVGVYGPILGLAVDSKGVIYRSGGTGIFTINTATGQLAVYAGNEQALGYSDGPALHAMFHYPNGLVFDKAGNLFVADTDNWMVREITTDGNVVTVAGKQPLVYPLKDGPASVATFYAPFGITIDPQGNLYVQDELHEIRKITFE
ncbi:IPT/TIG domain-containing protein [Mucilaginibacter sp. BJC16-A38]|uniref:IPT/TIG domain-containing protein n=1 Tax=Mucilaginibacter phenanthrenivorans TaxID=1234842 RepID=UPI002157201E|nr:IPT/TIG domain-containing protein [Mucilaginibacter phenanthrenivorans]MCR8560889.1 IPT/TIG domain-containing protein [Mucilaginibacter phenanthrenivorans]